MVGMEAADLLVTRACRVTVIEALASIAQGMARNNRMELIERVQAAGTQIVTQAQILGAAGRSLQLQVASENATRTLDIGEVLMIATGPRPVRDMVELLEAAGVEYALAGDCYRPGDFLTGIRDASMVALSVDHLGL